MPYSLYSVAAEVLPFAFLAVSPLPYAVDMVGGGIHQHGVVGEYAGFEVSVALALHADAGTREVRRTDIGGGAVEYYYLEMHPWAEPPFQPAPQPRILVEILAEVLTWLFGVQQTHIDTSSQQFVEHRQERHHILAAADIEVFEVGGAYPQVVIYLLATREDFGVMVFVGNVLEHKYY